MPRIMIHALPRRGAVAVAILLAGLTAFARSGQAEEVDLTSLPPDLPVRVEASVELLEVSQIADHEEKFDVEFYLYLRWNDPRLAFDAEREGRDKRTVPLDQIWTPAPQLMDELDVNVQSGDSAHVKYDGTVLWHQYYRGTVSSNFDLHEFPFDRHRLEVQLEAGGAETDQVVFVPADGEARSDARLLPHGWRFLGLSSRAAERRYARLNEAHPRFAFAVDIERDPHYYWWSIVLPLLPIVFTSWSVFWMDPKEFSSQVGVGITALLTIVAYRITIDSSLPPLTYMTRMDYFLLLCQTFVFAAFLMSVVIHVCHSLDTREMVALANRINVRCRWLPPPLMALACAMLLWLRPDLAMALVGGALGLFLLWCRPTWKNLNRWTRAALFPERLVDKPVQIQQSLLKGPTRPKARAS
ncbi:MAG TPA: hypothetical protein VHB99_10095 [Pirellulales bacterium]|nr:hypothetical protein [Pirellulales bacterium]